MGAGGYESWFVSARDPVSPRALWIRHTRHRPRQGPESAALWCTVIDRDLGQRPAVIKQVFSAFPPDAAAGPGQFRGQAAMGEHSARWDLAIAGGQPPLRPLRPPVLYRAPLPRTKLEAVVPDGQVTGMLQVDGREVSVSGWRGTAGHNWGSEHADSWVWLHAAGFGAAPEAWLELVLARIRVGPARSPWTAMGALGLSGERIALGRAGPAAQGRCPPWPPRRRRLRAGNPAPPVGGPRRGRPCGCGLRRPARGNPYRHPRRTGQRGTDHATSWQSRAHPVQQPRGLRVRRSPARARDRAGVAARGVSQLQRSLNRASVPRSTTGCRDRSGGRGRVRRQGFGAEDPGARPAPDSMSSSARTGFSAVCHTTAWEPYSAIDQALSTTWYR